MKLWVSQPYAKSKSTFLYLFYGTSTYNSDLTLNTTLIHTSFKYSKLNMDEICGLKSHLIYVRTYITKKIIEIHPCAKEVIFIIITEFAILW
jgi:hypothetical protein